MKILSTRYQIDGISKKWWCFQRKNREYKVEYLNKKYNENLNNFYFSVFIILSQNVKYSPKFFFKFL